MFPSIRARKAAAAKDSAHSASIPSSSSRIPRLKLGSALVQQPPAAGRRVEQGRQLMFSPFAAEHSNENAPQEQAAGGKKAPPASLTPRKRLRDPCDSASTDDRHTPNTSLRDATNYQAQQSIAHGPSVLFKGPGPQASHSTHTAQTSAASEMTPFSALLAGRLAREAALKVTAENKAAGGLSRSTETPAAVPAQDESSWLTGVPSSSTALPAGWTAGSPLKQGPGRSTAAPAGGVSELATKLPVQQSFQQAAVSQLSASYGSTCDEAARTCSSMDSADQQLQAALASLLGDRTNGAAASASSDGASRLQSDIGSNTLSRQAAAAQTAALRHSGNPFTSPAPPAADPAAAAAGGALCCPASPEPEPASPEIAPTISPELPHRATFQGSQPSSSQAMQPSSLTPAAHLQSQAVDALALQSSSQAHGFTTPPPLSPATSAAVSSVRRCVTAGRTAQEVAAAACNVQVAVRVRPPAPGDVSGEGPKLDVDPALQTVALLGGRHRHEYFFDHVYGPEAEQAGIFDGCAVELVDKFLAGFNATILAYGQTSSGKTYTMGTDGVVSFGEVRTGLLPRALHRIFAHLQRQQRASLAVAEGTSCQVECYFLEVYNDEMRDLLQPATPSRAIAIREGEDGQVLVQGAKAAKADSYNTAMRIFHKGSQARTTGVTRMNDRSSRSHAVFTVVLTQKRRRSPGGKVVQTVSKLHLVDLAGSERIKKTGAAGSRFKEAVNINQGLLAIGNVISALGDPAAKASHVPYRQSKITRLLKDALGGNSRTLMLACVSMADKDLAETLNTLKYANRARNIRNCPVVQQQQSDPDGVRWVQQQILAAVEAAAAVGAQLQVSGTSSYASVPRALLRQLREEDLWALLLLLKDQSQADLDPELRAVQEELARVQGQQQCTVRACQQLVVQLQDLSLCAGAQAPATTQQQLLTILDAACADLALLQDPLLPSPPTTSVVAIESGTRRSQGVQRTPVAALAASISSQLGSTSPASMRRRQAMWRTAYAPAAAPAPPPGGVASGVSWRPPPPSPGPLYTGLARGKFSSSIVSLAPALKPSAAAHQAPGAATQSAAADSQDGYLSSSVQDRLHKLMGTPSKAKLAGEGGFEAANSYQQDREAAAVGSGSTPLLAASRRQPLAGTGNQAARKKLGLRGLFKRAS